MTEEPSKVGSRIKNLRLRSNISLRQLARDAGVAVSYVSSIEKDAVSPTLTTLRKLLLALGTDLATFFADSENHQHKYIFRKGSMKTVNDSSRQYTFILPRRDDVHMQIMDEIFHTSGILPEFEVIESDLSGYVLNGTVTVEIGDEPPVELHCGDAFYVPGGVRVRGYCLNEGNARLLTFVHTPEY